MRKYFAVGAAFACVIGNAGAAEKLSKAEQEVVSRTPEQAEAFVSVQNDPLDTSIKMTTEQFYQQKQGLLKVVNADKFVRAWIDKKTGKTSFQVYIFVTYGGSGWQTFNRATYETADGPVEAEVDRISSDVLGCSTYGCSHREDFGFTVPEAVLRWATEGVTGASDAQWNFRVYSKAGEAQTTGLLKTEIAGLLRKVDQQRAALGVKQQP